MECSYPSKIHKFEHTLYINTTSSVFLWKVNYSDNLGKLMGLQIKGPRNNNTHEMRLFVVLCGEHMDSGCTKEGKLYPDKDLEKYVKAIQKARELFVVEAIFDSQINIKCNFIQ